jgi:hypothetical protein
MYISLPLHITCCYFSLFESSDGLKSVTTDFYYPICRVWGASRLYVLQSRCTERESQDKTESL